jgi:hypothetical protein
VQASQGSRRRTQWQSIIIIITILFMLIDHHHYPHHHNHHYHLLLFHHQHHHHLHRGQVSEGMDFADDRARAVLVTGIPFAPAKDPKVQQKQRYLDQARANRGGGDLLQGEAWSW